MNKEVIANAVKTFWSKHKRTIIVSSAVAGAFKLGVEVGKRICAVEVMQMIDSMRNERKTYRYLRY